MCKYIRIILLTLFLSTLNPQLSTLRAEDVQYLTSEQFRERVFNYRTEREWKYLGDKPCVIDFYTSWCGWCKKQEPIFEAFAQEYCDQINFYKIDCEKNRDLAYVLGISSYPTILLIRADGKPLMLNGYREKAAWQHIFDEFFFDLK